MSLRTFVLFAAILAWFGHDGARAQITPPPSGGSICTLSGTQTTGYVLTATNGGTACAWQTVGGASVDNNTLKNAQFINDLSVSANTITGTTATTFPGAYAKGQSVIVQVANTNTGATTININTLGAKAVTKNGNTALAAGNLVAGNDYLMTYDGTEFEVLTFTILAVDIPTLNQNTTGNAATATNLASYPTLCSGSQFSQGLSSGSNNCATPSGGGGGTPGGTSGQVQYNNSGSFGGFTVSGDGTLNTSTGALVVTKINGTTPGNSCTNQAVTAISSSAVPTCTTLTSAYVNNSIALTGTDVNTSNQVTATHLAAALPVNQGGTGTTSTLTGLVRGSASAMTAAELSGDATTSGSNAVTVTKLNGTSLAGLATGILKNTTSTGVPSIATAGTDYAAANAATTVNGQTCTLGSTCTVTQSTALTGTPTQHGVAIGGTGQATSFTAVGTTGQVLTGVTGADPTWQAAGSGALTFLGQGVFTSGTACSSTGTVTTTCAATSITFSSIPGTYSGLMIQFSGRVTDSAAAENLNIQFNGDTGANYFSQSVQANQSSATGSASNATGTPFIAGVTGASANANRPALVTIEIPNYAGTTFFKMASAKEAYFSATGTNNALSSGVVGMEWENTGAITSVKLIDGGGGNYVAGSTVTLYGLQ